MFNVSNGLDLMVDSLIQSQSLVLSEEEYQILKKTGIYTKYFNLDSLGNDVLKVAINIYFPEEDSEEFIKDSNGNYIILEDSLGSPFLEVDEDDDEEEDLI